MGALVTDTMIVLFIEDILLVVYINLVGSPLFHFET